MYYICTETNLLQSDPFANISLGKTCHLQSKSGPEITLLSNFSLVFTNVNYSQNMATHQVLYNDHDRFLWPNQEGRRSSSFVFVSLLSYRVVNNNSNTTTTTTTVIAAQDQSIKTNCSRNKILRMAPTQCVEFANNVKRQQTTQSLATLARQNRLHTKDNKAALYIYWTICKHYSIYIERQVP